MENLETHLQNQAENSDRFRNFFWHVTRSQFVLKALKKYSKTHSVVDVGAGAGVFQFHYKMAFPKAQYYFIEPIAALRERLQKASGSYAVQGENTPLPQEAIVLLDVVEHIENDVEFLKSLHSRMASGSLAIITCPAFKLLWSHWDVKMGHFRRYRRKQLVKVAQAAGFEVLESRYLFHLFLLPGLWRKWKPDASAEFPDLSPRMNQILKFWALFELKFLSVLPFGTSVTLVARKP